jgi:hypothetical protein
MLKLILITAVFLPALSFADTYVNGYTRSNGTYVAPHMRTNSDNTNLNNYSTQGNVNPYNGNVGHVQPNYQQPMPNPYNTNPYGH